MLFKSIEDLCKQFYEDQTDYRGNIVAVVVTPSTKDRIVKKLTEQGFINVFGQDNWHSHTLGLNFRFFDLGRVEDHVVGLELYSVVFDNDVLYNLDMRQFMWFKSRIRATGNYSDMHVITDLSWIGSEFKDTVYMKGF